MQRTTTGGGFWWAARCAANERRRRSLLECCLGPVTYRSYLPQQARTAGWEPLPPEFTAANPPPLAPLNVRFRQIWLDILLNHLSKATAVSDFSFREFLRRRLLARTPADKRLEIHAEGGAETARVRVLQVIAISQTEPGRDHNFGRIKFIGHVFHPELCAVVAVVRLNPDCQIQ